MLIYLFFKVKFKRLRKRIQRGDNGASC